MIKGMLGLDGITRIGRKVEYHAVHGDLNLV